MIRSRYLFYFTFCYRKNGQKICISHLFAMVVQFHKRTAARSGLDPGKKTKGGPGVLQEI